MNSKYFNFDNNPRVGQYNPPIILKKGQYSAILVKVTAGEGRAPQSNEIRKTLCFTFITNDADAVSINRTVTASLDVRSKLYELLRQLAPSENTLRMTPEETERLIDDLVGKKFNLVVEPSLNGKFNNLISASPLGSC